MAIEAVDAEKLVRVQREAIGNFFGAEVPTPPDRLFIVCEMIGQEKLWKPEPFYVPKRHLAEDVSFPGLRQPLDPWLYEQISAKNVDSDADWLPGQWVIWDPTRRPEYDNGRQMYPDTRQFKEILAELRNKGQIEEYNKYIREDSRFALSPDEIDGSKGVVAKEVAKILKLESGEVVSTPSYAVLNYVGNLAHPELGEVDTSEWLRNSFRRGDRLSSGDSLCGGLSRVYAWQSGCRGGSIGFRLQVALPAAA